MRNRTGPIHAVISTSLRLGAVFLLLAAALATDTSPAAAQAGKSPGGTRIFMTIEGAKQGKFKGEPGLGDRIPIFRINFGLKSPRDMATGQASGKRQWGPIGINADWGAASTQLMHATATNEALKSVLIEVFRATASGQEEPVAIIKLTDATIADFTTRVLDSISGDGPAGRLVEEIHLTFRKIEVSNPAAKTIFTDDWAVTQ